MFFEKQEAELPFFSNWVASRDVFYKKKNVKEVIKR